MALLAALGLAGFRSSAPAAGPPLAWTSPDRYRVLLEVDPRGVRRSHSPARVDLDLAAELSARGERGILGEDTIEVVAYDDDGRPRVFDRARGGDRALLPWRVERAYPLSRLRLSFVMPDERATRYAVYFDTQESGRARPPRYPGIV